MLLKILSNWKWQIVVTITCIILGFIWGWKWGRSSTVKKYTKEIELITTELDVVKESFKNCDSAIYIQNEAIERVRVDTVQLQSKIIEMREKYMVMRDTIYEQLEKDTSYENQVHLVDNLLSNFLTKRMYPQSSD